MKKAIFNFSALSALLVPAMAFAQTPNFNYVNSWVSNGLTYLRLAITVITILMTVFFLYNVLRFIMNKDPKNAPDLKQNMINGLIGLFVAAAVWGIVRLAVNITGVDTAPVNTITCPPGLVYNQSQGTCSTNSGGLF
ncbi:MAG: hypothetical protein V4478_02765 [Patescibacteria group bacterium]